MLFHLSIIFKNGEDGSIYPLCQLSFHKYDNFGQLSEELHEKKAEAGQKVLILTEFHKSWNAPLI